MQLLQTRVEDKVARLFERAAADRKMTKYQFLGELVKDAAALPEPRGWKQHRRQVAEINPKPLAFHSVVQDREEAGER